MVRQWLVPKDESVESTNTCKHSIRTITNAAMFCLCDVSWRGKTDCDNKLVGQLTFILICIVYMAIAFAWNVPIAL